MSRAARRIMAPAMSRSCCPLRVVAWLALLVAAPLVAQEPPPAAPPAGAVRVVVVRGSGELQDDREPEVAPGLAPYAEQLGKLELARYELLGQSEQKGADPSVPLRFELPLGLRLEARPPAADAPPPRPEDAAGKVRLVLHVTRPDPDAPADAPRMETVVEVEVLLAPGQPCLLRCVDALPEGDLLLLVSAGPRG